MSIEAIQEAQREIVEEFEKCASWEERYMRIIDLGREIPDLPDELKQEKYRVRGCQSTVYLIPELEDGTVRYRATSDAMIVRGLIALLMRVYNDRTPEEIIRTEPEFIQRIGLAENLTQGRMNGLAAMIEQMKLYGLAYKTMAAKGN